MSEEASEEENYEVEMILDKRMVGQRNIWEFHIIFNQVKNKTQYLVKWVGYSREESTWEPNKVTLAKQRSVDFLYLEP